MKATGFLKEKVLTRYFILDMASIGPVMKGCIQNECVYCVFRSGEERRGEEGGEEAW